MAFDTDSAEQDTDLRFAAHSPPGEHDPGFRQSTQVAETNEEVRLIPDNELTSEIAPKSDAEYTQFRNSLQRSTVMACTGRRDR